MQLFSNFLAFYREQLFSPGAPLTYFNDGGGGSSAFFGSEILAKGDFLGSMKDAGIFLGREKKQRDFLGLRKKN